VRETLPDRKMPASEISAGLRMAGMFVRVAFIAALVMLTARVSIPQNETIWSAAETPADLIRLALGVALCLWMVMQLFTVPKDVQAYRTWLYVGLAAMPLAVICVIAIW
jgi:hypothetical protein